MNSAVVDATLKAAGISDGSYNPPPGMNITAASATATSLAGAFVVKDPLVIQNLTNGWSMLKPNFTGDFGVHYGIRAFVAATGYLMLTASNSIYPMYANSSDPGAKPSSFTLGSNEALLFDFVGGKPPFRRHRLLELDIVQRRGLLGQQHYQSVLPWRSQQFDIFRRQDGPRQQRELSERKSSDPRSTQRQGASIELDQQLASCTRWWRGHSNAVEVL